MIEGPTPAPVTAEMENVYECPATNPPNTLKVSPRATVIISSNSKPNFQSQTLYQHQSVLRLTLAALGVDKFPGRSAAAPDMTEFFTGH